MEYLLELGQKTRCLLSGSKDERDRCPAQEGRRFKRGGYDAKRADDSFVYYLINITTQIDRQFKYKPIIPPDSRRFEQSDPTDPAGDEVAMYNPKWPDAPISLAPGSRTERGDYLGIQPHDPVMIMSSDGGNTWRLATSADLGINIVPEPAIPGMLGLIVVGLQRRGRSRERMGIRARPGSGVV